MPNYRRWYIPGGTVFCTLVTYGRRALFADSQARHLLGRVMRKVRSELPFDTIAMVLLPDHLHAIWKLPHDDTDFSTRWKRIKREFTVAWLDAGGSEHQVTRAQSRRGNRGIWQRRFHEHQVRDDDDLASLCDYIHYNPKKHGYVTIPQAWPWSTLHRFIRAGNYAADWGRSEPQSIKDLDLG